MNRKIIVIGCPGSGKSTFARKLHARTGIPLFHLDLLYHLPDRTTLGREDFDSALQAILDRPEWIMDGNYLRTLPMRLEKCNEVFFFDLPVQSCLEGALARVGLKRPDMPWIEMEPDPEFLEYIRNFRHEQLPVIERLLAQYGESLTVTVFHSREEADRWLAEPGQQD